MPRQLVGVALLALSLAAVVGLAGLAPKWTYASASRIAWSAISGDGETIFLYTVDGHIYVLDSKGGERRILRPGPLAKNLAGDLIIEAPRMASGLVYAISGEDGQVLEAVDSQGETLWSVYVPGQILDLATSPGGAYVAAAVLPKSLPEGETTVAVRLVRRGEAVQPLAIRVSGVTEAAAMRLAVSDDGVVALYNPRAGRIQVYTPKGALVWEAGKTGPPASLCLSPPGSLLVSARVQGGTTLLDVYRVGTGLLRTLEFKGPYSLSPDCVYASWYDENSTVRLVNLETGEEKSLGVLAAVQLLGVSEKGSYVLAAGGYRYALLSPQGAMIGDGFTLSPIEDAHISADGSGILVVDTWSRAYFIQNPRAMMLEAILKMLGLGVAFALGLILYIRHRSAPPPPEEEHEEEIYPPE